MGVRSQGNPRQCVSSQHFPPHPTLNLSLPQAWLLYKLRHFGCVPSCTPGPLSCPSLFSYSSFLTIPPSLSCHGPVILLVKFSLDPCRCPWPFVLFLIFVVNVLNHTYLRAVMSTCFHSSGAKITGLASMSAFPRDLAASCSGGQERATAKVDETGFWEKRRPKLL